MFENLSTLAPSVAAGFSSLVKHGAADEMIKSLNYYWYSTIGYKAERAAKLKEIDNKLLYEAAEKELNDYAKFKSEIEKRLSQIEEGNLQRPIEYIAHPAMSQSASYISESLFRNMFAKLIAASMDKSKVNTIHTSYVQLIKELTPLDAKLLETISIKGNDHIVKLIMRTAIDSNEYNDNHIELLNNLYIADDEYKEHTLVAPSIDNLVRLGLVSVTYDKYRIYSKLYDEFMETPEYNKLYDKIKSPAYIKSKLNVPFMYDLNPDFFEHTFNLDMKKGIITLTDFGRNFYEVCL